MVSLHMTHTAWEKTISEALSNLGADFEPNELAYLALTSKVELPIRDKLAFHLHRQFNKETNIHIAREWGMIDRRRIDLAVIEDDVPSMLLEIKAMYSFDMFTKNANYQYSKLVEKDVEKMRDFVTTNLQNSPTLLTLLLATHPHTTPSRQLDRIVKYNAEIEKYQPPSTEAIRKAVSKHFHAHPSHKGGEIEGGRAFDTNVSVLYWLFGPYKNAN